MIASDAPRSRIAETLETEVSTWLIEQGLAGLDMQALVGGFADRVVAGGVRLSRTFLGMQTLSPEVRAFAVTWEKGRAAVLLRIDHHSAPDDFQNSPIQYLLVNGLPRRRWRLARGEGTAEYQLLDELRASGNTDYIAELVRFGASSPFAVQGVALTACTDVPGGFSDEEVALMSRLTQPLALAIYRIALFDIATTLVRAYVGHDAGLRILNGEIRRGEGRRIDGAILMADLSGFTPVAESGGEALIARLGEHLAAMVEPIEARGGEVLKFMGDGILAGFPIGPDPGTSCVAALDAACAALVTNEAVNARYAASSPLPLKVGLHRGEVFYGNVGAGSRLDFTVIGPAVNETSRLMGLCGTLNRSILMSESFAASCPSRAVSVGHFVLRGVSGKREVFAPTVEEATT